MPNSEGVPKFTTSLPKNNNDGIFGFRDIKDLFFNKGKSIFLLFIKIKIFNF